MEYTDRNNSYMVVDKVGDSLDITGGHETLGSKCNQSLNSNHGFSQTITKFQFYSRFLEILFSTSPACG